MNSLTLIPHSVPALTSFASFFSRFKLRISPSYIVSEFLVTLTLAFLLTEPSTTIQPAIEPIFETLKICRTSALPIKLS